MLRVDDDTKDSIEVYTVSQDDILGNISPLRNPEPIESSRGDCRNFLHAAFAAVKLILSHLDKHLDLKPGTLATQCALDKQSATSLCLLRSPAQTVNDARRINFGGHTDIGIITLLLKVTGGLQVLPAGSKNVYENWRYIQPQPGCAIINIGDTLTEWTGGLLRSSLHRVVSPPGTQAQFSRQSLAYLVRAEKWATTQRLKGSRVIPPTGVEEEEDTSTVDSWAVWRAQQIMSGVLKAETKGGQWLLVRRNQTTSRGLHTYLGILLQVYGRHDCMYLHMMCSKFALNKLTSISASSKWPGVCNFHKLCSRVLGYGQDTMFHHQPR